MLQVPEGQRINLTLLDFGLRPRNHTATAMGQGSQHNLCRVYATLRERSPGRSVTVCGGRQRERHVYTSDTNVVELRILHNQAANEPVYFLFRYRGKRLRAYHKTLHPHLAGCQTRQLPKRSPFSRDIPCLSFENAF